MSTRQTDLEKHIVENSFPTRKATVDNMRALGQEVNEAESLFMNLQYYHLIQDIDYLRPSQDESDRIFASKSRYPVVRQNVLNKENVRVQHVQLKTVPIQNIQIETVPSINILNSKDVYLVNPQQSMNSFFVNPSYLQTTATNYQLPMTSEMISNTNNSVLRDVLLNKRVDNVVRGEVSETVENLDKQVEEFDETEEVTTGILDTVKESTTPNVSVSVLK